MSVREYAILYTGKGGKTAGGTAAGGGNAILVTGPHTLDGPEHSDAGAGTRLDATIAHHGLLPVLPNDATKFLNGVGGYTAPTVGPVSPIAIRYTFSTTTTDADPGSGLLRLSNATQYLAVTVRADLADVAGADVTALLDSIDDAGPNTVLGWLRLQHQTDASKWLVATVSAIASPSGYRNITIANIAKSANSPFANGDPVLLSFLPLLTNPATTSQDLLVAGSGGVLGRLGKGSDSQVLTVDPTTHLLSWATPAAGGGSLTTIEEVDGSPTDSAITKLVFPNGTLAIVGHVATYTPSGGGGSDLLAIMTYAGSAGDTTKTTTSTSFVDVDATNIAITFTTPASGAVIVRVYLPGIANPGSGIFFNLRESTTNIGMGTLVGASSFIVPAFFLFYITGISAGSHTYKLGWRVDGSTNTLYYGNTARGPVVMEVRAA